MDMIESNIDLPWDWNYVSENPNLTFEFVQKYIDKPWDWEVISRNYLWYYLNLTLWYYDNRKEQTIKNTGYFKDELLGVTWEPLRFKKWCLTQEEQRRNRKSLGLNF